jgi:hypothetical protein
MIEEAVRQWVEDLLQKQRRHGSGNFTEQSKDQAASFLADAMVDWMGPGGDEAFVVMYLLANGGGLDSLLGKPRLEGKTPLNERRRRITICCAEFLESSPSSARLTERGYVRPPGGDPLPENDEVLFDLLKEGVDNRDPSVEFQVERMLLAQRRLAMPVFYDMDPPYPALLSVEPAPGYRTLLMGELAQPWEVLPPPYGPYQPKRRPYGPYQPKRRP